MMGMGLRSAVMPALVAGIHALNTPSQETTWMAVTSPAMTLEVVPDYEHLF
jgi:hypothetical protein